MNASARRPALVIGLVTTGFVSIPSQVILLRELTVAFYGVELVYLLGLGTWLAWVALGASLAHRRWPASAGGLAALFGLLAVALPLSVAFLRAARPLLSGLPGASWPAAGKPWKINADMQSVNADFIFCPSLIVGMQAACQLMPVA